MKLNKMFNTKLNTTDEMIDVTKKIQKIVDNKISNKSNKFPLPGNVLPAEDAGPLPLNWPTKEQSGTQQDGGQYHGPCPLCEQKTGDGGEDRFLIWPNHSNKEGGTKWKWRCSKCDSSGGDAIDFVQKYYGVKFDIAKAMVTEPSEDRQVTVKWEPPDESTKKTWDIVGNIAVKYYDTDKPVSDDHPYLKRKKVNACAGMYALQRKVMCGGIKFEPSDIAVPIISYNDNDENPEVVTGLHVINRDDGKKNKGVVKGSIKQGGYFCIPCKEGFESDRLLIAEGLANGLTVNQATGFETLVAFDAGNLKNVAAMARHRWPDRDIVLCCDNDIGDGKNNLGMASAVKAAGAISGFLAIPEWNGKKCDFNDILTQSDDIGKNRAVICNAIEHAKRVNYTAYSSKSQCHSKESDEAKIEQLAALAESDPLEYGRAKKESAKRLGVTVPELDKLVSSRKDYNTLFKQYDISPCQEAVSGAQLTKYIYAVIDRFIVCSEETKVAATMWIIMTWFPDVIDYAPIALITAPEKRCGKTTLLIIMEKLVYMPLPSAGISAAAVFRTVEKYHPTFLIDEFADFVKDNPHLNGILKSGVKPNGKYTITAGDNHDTKTFSTYAPKALAGIGTLDDDALMDRSIILELSRKGKGDTVERLRNAEQEMWNTLRSYLRRFATDNKDAVKNAKPPLPGKLNDREQDCWEPILQIATVIDADDTDSDNGTFYDEVVKTAITISRNANKGEESDSVELLRCIREVFDSLNMKRMKTGDLIHELCKNENWRWRYYRHGRYNIDGNTIAKLLKGYDIKPCQWSEGKEKPRGYKRDDFTDAFKRYL